MPNSTATLLRLLVFLSAFDTGLTLAVVGLKWADEANPIMNYFLQQGPLVFGASKLALSIGGALLLWKGRKSTWALPAVSLCVFVYAALVSYELAMVLATISGG